MFAIRAARLSFPAGIVIWLAGSLVSAGEEWPQLKCDGRHSGNVPERAVAPPLGLLGAVPLSDSVFTAPVVVGGRIYAVDGSGVAWCMDATTLEVRWRFASPGGPVNCNCVSSPAVVGQYLHFGTTGGSYFVLDVRDGSVVRRIRWGEPIFSAPVVVGERVYCATVGAQVSCLTADGKTCWTWDFVKEQLGFAGNRWSGEEWLRHKQGRVTWKDAFCCATDIAAFDKTIVVSAGGRTLFLEDQGDHPRLRAIGLVPSYAGSEYPASFGHAIGDDNAVYVQWHRRDNSGRVEVFRLQDDKVTTDWVRGTETAIQLPGLLSFSAVSVRGNDVYRCRPENGLGFCRHPHPAGESKMQALGGYPSIASPVLTKNHGVFGGLDGRLHVVPLDGRGQSWSFATAFGAAISASACVCDGKVYFGCEDGYLYVLGPGGKAALPQQDLGLCRIRHPLQSRLADSQYDWFTNYADFSCTNANDQGVKPPFRVKWLRRYEGTFKHLPVCGGGRMYTHTSEGQIIAVEQETGRLLWRRYYPDVYLSFTSPLYFRERLLVPQAGMKQSLLRCLDAATGRLIWEAPFSGSPSWSRQGPPVLYKNLAIYAFGSGQYAAQGSAPPFVFSGKPVPRADGAEVMSWIYTHNNPHYPRDNQPLLRAWDVDTGKEVWRQDFSALGTGGNDCGLCVMGDTLHYSTFFGYAAKLDGKPSPRGVTAALDPATGKVRWQTTDYYVTAGCTLSGKDGRLYLGGYNRPHEATNQRYVWCLDARDGKLVWQSEPVASSVNVVTVGNRYLFSNASGKDGHVFDKATGKIVSRFTFGYACTRFAMSEPYVMGANLDLIDLSSGNRLVTSGPAIDSRECVGAIVSNGRMFYTSQASGLQMSQLYGEEAQRAGAPWDGGP